MASPPESNQQLRYWDGQHWSSATQPTPQQTLASTPPPPVAPEKIARGKVHTAAADELDAAVSGKEPGRERGT
ncbi:DUF2510 domain-containing protein [Rhodococcus sp. EPR-134]|uniref:DUF2510 domain-containing protein n=1 Tax=Rhodococcus sp. EPR-134 TaxID=1813675 RepID=UPI0012E919A9